MRYLDLTLPTAAENLALDEALLEAAVAAGRPTETLRFWEPAQPMVVLGRSSKLAAEVQQETCRELGVPVLRRTSGGAAVVAGPGCLMYALVLSIQRRPALGSVGGAHRSVLDMLAGAAWAIGRRPAPLRHQRPGPGPTEILRQQRPREAWAFALSRHAAVRLPPELIGRLLAMPPRQPDYRQGRPHDAFVLISLCRQRRYAGR